MTVINKTILVHAPIDKVYAFARDPHLWNTWYNGLAAADQISGNGEKGTVVKHHFTMAGISFPVTSRVVEDKPGPKEAFWKGEFEGPITGKHQWTYKAKGDNTEATVYLEYTVPGKALGVIADRLIIEKMQERSMDQTLDNLKLLCESEVAAAVTR